MSCRSALASLLLPLALLPAAPAAANGNVSHLWVTLWAVDELPDGELKDLLTRDEVDLALRNGANFPDGGYAVNDGYGEIAHWEPFQSAYLDWIVDNYEPPWSDEAAEHIAFLMGMASHGMSDQVYDSMYLSRAGIYDEGAPGSSIGMDGSTDVALAAEAGPLEAPELWIPDDVMAELMVEKMGYPVEAGTIRDGQALVAFSLYYVSNASLDPAQVAEHNDAYPWACAHQMDEGVPGSPPTTTPVVAAYWLRLWARLHGEDPLSDPLLARFPAADATGHPSDATDIEAMVSFVVARGLHSESVGAETVTVADADGQELATDLHLYYGHNSHVVNLRPVDGWTEGDSHTVTAGPGLRSWDDQDYDTFTFAFETDEDPAAPEEASCACSAFGARDHAGPCTLLGLIAAVLRRRRGCRARRSSHAPPLHSLIR